MKRKATIKIQKPIIFIVAFLFLMIIIKLSYVALSPKVDGINLSEFASNRNTKKEIIYAKRGNIYDKDDNVLASVVNSYKIIAYLDSNRTTNKNKPQHVVDKESTAKMLNEYLGISYEDAMKQLNKNKYQVEFGSKGKGIDENLKNKIAALEMPGIDFIASQKRTYSMGSFASYIIGYAKKNGNDDNSEIVGELGIESYYNKQLSGTNGSKTYETDAYGYTLPSSDVLIEKEKNGDNIYLTIDSNIQRFAESLTRELSSEYEMDWMIFAVMDAKTGAIVASSTYPNFNPNDLNTLKNYNNPLVSYEYEPGSTMKIFSFATSIEEGLYDGSSTYKSGSIEIDSETKIKDWNKTGWGLISYDTGFAYSSNVAAVNLALNLEKEKGTGILGDYYRKLGFASKTGVELANEVDGKVNIEYKSELATASFGQGITVTPIQMLQALSSLTNGGVTLKPYIVDKIVDDDGKIIYKGKRTEINKVYSKETVDYMRGLMHNMVYEGLSSGQYWRPSRTTMIGKTGTAQIASPTGGYLKGANDYVRSFAGIFPEENPEYIVYIATQKINTGASNIAKVLAKTVDDIAAYLGYENREDNIEKKVVTLDNYISKDINSVTSELRDKGLKVFVIGDGNYIINQYPNKNGKVQVGGKVFLVSNSTNYVLEDMSGWSVSEVKTYMNLLGLKAYYEGYGVLTNQSISPGTTINKDDEITITFSSS